MSFWQHAVRNRTSVKACGQLQDLRVIMKVTLCAFGLWQSSSGCDLGIPLILQAPFLLLMFSLNFPKCGLTALYSRVTSILPEG